MADQLVSRPTLDAFEDCLVRWNVVQGIRDLFDDAGIACDESYEATTSSTRRRVIAQYYRTVDRSSPRQVRKLLDAFGAVLQDLDHVIEDALPNDATFDDHRKTRERLVRRLGADGFEYRGGKVVPMGKAPALTHLRSIAVEFDYPYLLRELDRIEGAVESDPWQAIGTAKELLETVCKTILAETPGAKAIDKEWDLGQLCGATREALRLLPESIPRDAKARETITALLGNMGQVAQRLAELRNNYGTGHGHGGRAVGLQPRHARLAIGAASTLALFLYETHREQQEKNRGSD